MLKINKFINKLLTKEVCRSSKNVQNSSYTEASKEIRFRNGIAYFYCIRQTKNILSLFLIKRAPHTR